MQTHIDLEDPLLDNTSDSSTHSLQSNEHHDAASDDDTAHWLSHTNKRPCCTQINLGVTSTLGSITLEIPFAWFMTHYLAKSLQYTITPEKADNNASTPTSYFVPAIIFGFADLVINLTTLRPAEDTHDYFNSDSFEKRCNDITPPLTPFQKQRSQGMYYLTSILIITGNYLPLALSAADPFMENKQGYIPIAIFSAVFGTWYYNLLTDINILRTTLALSKGLSLQDFLSSQKIDATLSNIMPNALYRTISAGFIIVRMDFLDRAKIPLFWYCVLSTFITTLLSRSLDPLEALNKEQSTAQQTVNIMTRTLIAMSTGYLTYSTLSTNREKAIMVTVAAIIPYLLITLRATYLNHQPILQKPDNVIKQSTDESLAPLSLEEQEKHIAALTQAITQEQPNMLKLAHGLNFMARSARAMSFIYSLHTVMNYIDENYPSFSLGLNQMQTLCLALIFSSGILTNELTFYGPKIQTAWATLIVKWKTINEISPPLPLGDKLFTLFYQPINAPALKKPIETLHTQLQDALRHSEARSSTTTVQARHAAK